MDSILWLVASLALTLPAHFHSAGTSSTRHALPGPPGLEATEEFRSWKGKPGQELFVFYWEPRAPRPGGPMVSADQWKESVAGQTVTVHETSQFMGRPQRVLVAHLTFQSPEAQAMIYGTGLSRPEFSAILAKVARAKPAGPAGEPHRFQPPCSVCGKPSATLELLDVGSGLRLLYSGPGGSSGSTGTAVTPKEAAVLRSAFAPPYSFARIRTAHLYDDAGFCERCGGFYCPAHWNLTATGGGWCPKKHFKSLDPHASFD